MNLDDTKKATRKANNRELKELLDDLAEFHSKWPLPRIAEVQGVSRQAVRQRLIRRGTYDR